MDENLATQVQETFGVDADTAQNVVQKTRKRRQSTNDEVDRFVSNKDAQNGNEVVSLTQTDTPRNITAPQEPSPVAANALFEEVGAQTKTRDRIEDELQSDVDREREEQKTFESAVLDAFKQTQQLPEEEARLTEEAGIPENTEKRDVQQDKIDALERRRDLRIREIQDEAGLTAAQKDARINEEDRKFAREIADESIILNVLDKNLDRAQSQVDRKVELLTEQAKLQLDTTKFFLENNKDELTTAEENLLNRKLTKDQRAFEKQEGDIANTENFKLSALSTIIANGAPSSVQQAVMSAESKEEVLAAADGYMVDWNAKENDRLARKKLELEVEALETVDETDQVATEAINEMSDGAKEKLVNARTTTAQIERLQELIRTADDVSRLTSATETGREFIRIASDVADKLARERTGAVVSSDEEKTFKRILGLSIGSQILSDDQELIDNLDQFKNKHQQVVTLNDPTGEVSAFLDKQAPVVTSTSATNEDYLDYVDEALNSAGEVYNTYFNN